MSTFDEETRSKVDLLLKEAERAILRAYPSAEELLSIHRYQCKPYEKDRFVREEDVPVYATKQAVTESEKVWVRFHKVDQEKTGLTGMMGYSEQMIFINEPVMLRKRQEEGEAFFELSILTSLIHELLHIVFDYLPSFARMSSKLREECTVVLSTQIIESLDNYPSELKQRVMRLGRANACMKNFREKRGQEFIDSMKKEVREQFERLQISLDYINS